MKTITFEEAIAYTEALLLRQDLDETILESAITELLQTANGARGFLVVFLTGEWELADCPSDALIRALRSNAIAELLVKNLVMSTAMAITHRRAENSAQAQASELVAKRVALLIAKVNLAEISTIITQMRGSAISGSGEYAAFLEKWGYDAEQKQAIAASLQKY